MVRREGEAMGRVAAHYWGGGPLAEVIARELRRAGKDAGALTTADLASFDEFHIGGREATLGLARAMRLTPSSRVLDIGSGLGGPARTLAEAFGCPVIGIDLTPEFCEAARTLSGWVRLGDRVEFRQGDATDLPFADASFDAAMTLQNIAAKDRLYGEARRVLKPGGIFVAYDILQGEGGDVIYPVPWAREPSISHLVTPAGMTSLLGAAGFRVIDVRDSSDDGLAWFEELTRRMAGPGPRPLTARIFLGDDFPVMARNQIRNLGERRIRTVSFVCEA
jgi:ubiquinone/menaquinone biosynthesis C-methylase UbiE